MGHSLGGGVCQDIMVAKPNLVQAFVLYAPVSADYIDNFNRWAVKDRADIAHEFIKKHGTSEENPQFWNELSAINYLDRIEDPIMINHGTKDESCPFAWSQKLASALNKAGKNYEFVVYSGERHEFGPQWPLFMQKTAKFFQDNL